MERSEERERTECQSRSPWITNGASDKTAHLHFLLLPPISSIPSLSQRNKLTKPLY